MPTGTDSGVSSSEGGEPGRVGAAQHADTGPGHVPGVPADRTSEPMPGWVPRAILLAVGAFAGLLLVRWLIAELQSLILILLVSLFMSFALEPAVNWLNHKGMRRGLATGLTILTVFLGFIVFIALIGSALFSQVSDFLDELPTYIEDLEVTLNNQFGLEIDADELIAELQSEDGRIQELATNMAGQAVQLGLSAVGVLFALFTILLFTFYMVADGPRFRRTVLQFLPPHRQERVVAGWELAIEKTGGYIYSRSLLALISAVATAIALELLGLPYAIALALWVGVISQFIPTVGTYLAGALPVLVAAFEDPVTAALVLGFIIVYQQIENYVFAPKITARTMDIHPAVAFGSVVAGAALFGGVGALLALPAAAVIQAVGSTYVLRHEVIDSGITREAVVSAKAARRRSEAETEDDSASGSPGGPGGG